MTLFFCAILPLIAVIGLLILFRRLNFSLIPEGLRLPAPKRFKLPEVRRDERYRWYIERSKDDKEHSDDE